MVNVLVCDDEKDIVSALRIYLESEGYQVYTAYDGLEALEVLERFCRMVAVQIYNLTVLLDVEKVAIGGGISKQPLLLDDLRRVYAGLFASRGESPYMIGLPRCEIVPCHFSSEANQVGALYTYLQAESKTI